MTATCPVDTGQGRLSAAPCAKYVPKFWTSRTGPQEVASRAASPRVCGEGSNAAAAGSGIVRATNRELLGYVEGKGLPGADGGACVGRVC